MPGFVDSHTHLVFANSLLSDFESRIRAAGSQQPSLAPGIDASVRALRCMSPRNLENKALRWLGFLAACGTTTVEGKSGYGLTAASERKTLRVMERINGRPIDVVRTFFGAHVRPSEFADAPDDYITSIVTELLPDLKRRALAQFCDVFCDPEGFTPEQARRVLEAAKRLGFGLKVHLGAASYPGAIPLAVILGTASADCPGEISAHDVELLSSSKTVATLLPAPAVHFASGRFPPARRLFEGGAAVALATSFNPVSSPILNMQIILGLACRHMEITPAEAVSAATINGAAAIGLAASIGSLEPRKFADVIMLDVGDYREIAYYFGTNLVRMTMRHGRIIWDQTSGLAPIKEAGA
jgi:imidazolonepropionase